MISFEIPGLPKSPNQLLGAHWRVRSGHKKTWLTLVHLAIRTQLPRAPHQTAKLTLTRFSSVEPDTDNLRGSFKAIIDSLVNLRVIVNDKRENIGEPIVLWEKIAPKHGKIRVEIELL